MDNRMFVYAMEAISEEPVDAVELILSPDVFVYAPDPIIVEAFKASEEAVAKRAAARKEKAKERLSTAVFAAEENGHVDSSAEKNYFL